MTCEISEDYNLLFLNEVKPVHITNVLAAVVVAVDGQQLGADSDELLKEAQLRDDAHSDRRNNYIGSGFGDNFAIFFEDDKVDVCLGEGEGCSEADGATACDDDFKGHGVVLVCKIVLNVYDGKSWIEMFVVDVMMIHFLKREMMALLYFNRQRCIIPVTAVNYGKALVDSVAVAFASHLAQPELGR